MEHEKPKEVLRTPSVLKSDELLAETQQLTKLGSWEWDAETNRVTWSDELYRIYGLCPREFPATFEGYLDRVHPEDRQRVQGAIQKAFVEGSSFDHEARIVRSDGAVRILHSRGRAVSDCSGPPRMVGTCQDVTEKRHAETRLHETEQRFREIAETIAEAFWVTSADLKTVHYLSPAWETIFGTPSEPLESLQERWLAVIHPDDRQAVIRELNKGAAPEHTYRILRPDGTVRWIQCRGFPVRSSSGEVLRYTGLAQDITSLKETEEALRDAKQQLAEALGRSEERVVQLEEQVRTRTAFDRLVGKSPAMQEVYRKLRLASQSEVTVLLTGESGTGKELAASAIHALSARKDGPFVAVNCSAIPEALLESELFGHVKGAFTGAVRDKVGLFQAAEGGTLFLDEVGDMSAALQVKVLRALQEREVRRVGDENAVKVDVRVIAATNRDLPRLIASGKMREDFYYRIRVFGITLPPLRNRREDIPLLARHFLARAGAGRDIDPGALRALLEHGWPGNVRELQNAVEHALVMATGPRLTLDDLPHEVRKGASGSASFSPEEHAERERLRAALQASGWNRTRAAASLGTSRVTLWKKMRRLGLTPAGGANLTP